MQEYLRALAQEASGQQNPLVAADAEKQSDGNLVPADKVSGWGLIEVLTS